VREGVDHCVRRARLVLNGEVEAEQLAHPMMPRNGGEAFGRGGTSGCSGPS
jgi:hypothetical protein